MNDHKKLLIIGAGGHGKVVCAIARKMGHDVAGFIDDRKKIGYRIMKSYVIGSVQDLINMKEELLLHIGIGDNKIRKKISKKLYNKKYATLVHPTSDVHESSVIGLGSLVSSKVIIQPDVEVGEHVIINSGAIIEHDCKISSFTHIAPGAILCGGATVEEGATVFAGAVVAPNCKIGAWATVGAGSVVITDVPSSTIVVGAPARKK